MMRYTRCIISKYSFLFFQLLIIVFIEPLNFIQFFSALYLIFYKYRILVSYLPFGVIVSHTQNLQMGAVFFHADVVYFTTHFTWIIIATAVGSNKEKYRINLANERKKCKLKHLSQAIRIYRIVYKTR